MCDYNEYHINDDDDDLTEILKIIKSSILDI